MVTSGQRFTWDETAWTWDRCYGRQDAAQFHVVAIDYGIKRNILRQLAGNGCKVTVVAAASSQDILALAADGVFLSNGPGGPGRDRQYAVPVIRDIIDSGIPTFRISSVTRCCGKARLAPGRTETAPAGQITRHRHPVIRILSPARSTSPP